MTINKRQLISALAKNFDILESESRVLVNHYLDTIISMTAQGRILNVPFVGRFYFQYRKPVLARDLQTNTQLKTAAGGGYNLRCDLSAESLNGDNLLIDTVFSFRLFASCKNIPTETADELILEIGKLISKQVLDGKKITIRSFGIIERKIKCHYYYKFKCAKCLRQLADLSYPKSMAE